MCGEIGQLNDTPQDLFCYGSDWPSSSGGNIGYWAEYILVGTGGGHASNIGNNLTGIDSGGGDSDAAYFVR